MSIRGVGRGGKAGGPKGPSGPGKASGTGFKNKVEAAGSASNTQGLVGPSGAAGSSNVAGPGAAGPTDSVQLQVLEIARAMREGQIRSRDEATKRLVTDILRQKVRIQSKKLAEKIFEHLKDDPRLAQTLERMWSRAEEQE